MATIVGLGLSLSSTAIVMQMLGEKGQATNPLGQTITSILVFQDIFIVFLLMLVPVLAGGGDTAIGAAIGMAFAKIIGALIAVYAMGKYVLQPLLRRLIDFAREELFTAAILLIILTTASFTGMVGLSLPLGAFLAGLIISETEYCYMVKAEITPFRTLLLGLFFISVGMSLDLTFLIEHFGTIMMLVAALIAIKTLSLIPMALSQRRSWLTASQMGLWLAQAGEFGFVLFGMAYKDSLIDEALYQYLMVVIGISFVATPLLVLIAEKLASCFEAPGEGEHTDASGKVIILGFGAEGKNIARILHGAGVEYLGVDSDQNRILMAHSQGVNIAHGDITTRALYDSLEVGKASAVMLALDNDHNIKKITQRMQKLYPSLLVFANVIEPENMHSLEEDGIICIAGDPHQTGIASARKILEYFHKDADDISRVIDNLLRGHKEELAS